jgi:hypothetical protein
MLYGPTIIKKCSVCSNLIKKDTIASGNTIGAKFWTDSKVDAPMLSEQPWLVKCLHCQSLIWIDEQEKVSEIDFNTDYHSLNTDANYNRARPCISPALEDYFAFLEKNKLTKEKELYLRIRAWWAGNDKRRGIKNTTKSMSDAEKSNLQALANMLNISDDGDCILLAEIKRELEDFESAITLLERTFPDQLSQVASIIRELAKKQYPFVGEIKLEN